MDSTARHNLPYLLPNQAQKHVTINQSLDHVDALLGASVISRQRSQEPPAPVEGDAYLLPSGLSGDAWSALSEDSLVIFRDGTWQVIASTPGTRVWIADEGVSLVFANEGWRTDAATSVDTFGVQASADSTNRLAVKSDAVLFSHDDVSPGSGDMRHIINRQSVTRIASMLFQTDNDAGAEIGLLGSDDLHIKVRETGGSFQTGLSVQAEDGKVALPAGFAAPLDVLSALGMRHDFSTIGDDSVGVLDFGSPVFGATILVISNALSSGPVAFFYARMASTPSLTPLFSAGHSFTTQTGDLSGTTGTDGGINFSVTDDGQFIIENRRGYPVVYKAFIFL